MQQNLDRRSEKPIDQKNRSIRKTDRSAKNNADPQPSTRDRIYQQNPFYLSEGEQALLVPDAGPLNHDEVLLHLTVVRETAHRVNRLVGQIVPAQGLIKFNHMYLTSWL